MASNSESDKEPGAVSKDMRVESSLLEKGCLVFEIPGIDCQIELPPCNLFGPASAP